MISDSKLHTIIRNENWAWGRGDEEIVLFSIVLPIHFKGQIKTNGKKEGKHVDLVSILASCMWAEVLISSDSSQSSSQERLPPESKFSEYWVWFTLQTNNISDILRI